MSNSYHFGSVSGPLNTGSPYNCGGNQIVGSGGIKITGGNRNGQALDSAVVEALAGLRSGLDELRLTGSERKGADEDLAGVEEAGENKPAAAAAFESFVSRLREAGALAHAGAEFFGAASKLTRWLGPLASGALALIHG